jgi:hypothetical protein
MRASSSASSTRRAGVARLGEEVGDTWQRLPISQRARR